MNKRKNKRRSAYSPTPSRSPSSLKAASRSSRSLLSHSEISLAAASASSATGGPAVLPTYVVARESRSAWLHRSSADSSTILVRPLPRVGPGSLLGSSKTGLLLTFPLRAVEQMLASLNLVLAPPTAVEWPTQGTVLSGSAVSHDCR